MSKKPKKEIDVVYTHNMGDDVETLKIFKILEKTPGFSLIEDKTLEPNSIHVVIKKMTVAGMDIRESVIGVYKSYKKYSKADKTGMLIRHIRGSEYRAKYGSHKFKMIIELERSIADLAESCYFSTHDEWVADVAIRGGRESMEAFLAG